MLALSTLLLRSPPATPAASSGTARPAIDASPFAALLAHAPTDDEAIAAERQTGAADGNDLPPMPETMALPVWFIPPPPTPDIIAEPPPADSAFDGAPVGAASPARSPLAEATVDATYDGLRAGNAPATTSPAGGIVPAVPAPETRIAIAPDDGAGFATSRSRLLASVAPDALPVAAGTPIGTEDSAVQLPTRQRTLRDAAQNVAQAGRSKTVPAGAATDATKRIAADRSAPASPGIGPVPLTAPPAPTADIPTATRIVAPVDAVTNATKSVAADRSPPASIGIYPTPLMANAAPAADNAPAAQSVAPTAYKRLAAPVAGTTEITNATPMDTITATDRPAAGDHGSPADHVAFRLQRVGTMPAHGSPADATRPRGDSTSERYGLVASTESTLALPVDPPRPPRFAVTARAAAPTGADHSPAVAPRRDATLTAPAATALPVAMSHAATPDAVHPPRRRVTDSLPVGIADPVVAVTAGPAPASLAPAALDPNDSGWMTAMIDRIETLRDAGGDAVETRIRLTPDALGAIDVTIERDGDEVAIRFAAEVPATRAILADAAPRLVELAEARGLRLTGGADTAGTGSGQSQHGEPQHRDTPRPNRAPPRPTPDTEPATDHRIA